MGIKITASIPDAPVVPVEQDATELRLVIPIPLKNLPGYSGEETMSLQPIEIHYTLSDLKEVDLNKADADAAEDDRSVHPYRLVSGTTVGDIRSTYHRVYGFCRDSHTWIQLGEVPLSIRTVGDQPPWKAFLLKPFWVLFDVLYATIALTVAPAFYMIMAFPQLLFLIPLK